MARSSSERRALSRRAALRNRRTSFIRSRWPHPDHLCVWSADPQVILEVVGYRPFYVPEAVCLTHHLTAEHHPELSLGRFRDRAAQRRPRWVCDCWHCSRPRPRPRPSRAAAIKEGVIDWLDEQAEGTTEEEHLGF